MAVNLVTNGDFSGGTTGWTLAPGGSMLNTKSYTGTNSIKLLTGQSIAQSINLLSGNYSLTFSYLALNAVGTASNFDITLSDIATGTTILPAIYDLHSSNTICPDAYMTQTWITMHVYFLGVGADNWRLRIAGNDVLIDSISLYNMNGLIDNMVFLSLNGWTVTGGTSNLSASGLEIDIVNGANSILSSSALALNGSYYLELDIYHSNNASIFPNTVNIGPHEFNLITTFESDVFHKVLFYCELAAGTHQISINLNNTADPTIKYTVSSVALFPVQSSSVELNIDNFVITEFNPVCYSGRSYVVMADGTKKRVRDVKKGDMVLGKYNNYEKPTTVTHNIITRAPQKIFRLTNSESLLITGGHHVLKGARAIKARDIPFAEHILWSEHVVYTIMTKDSCWLSINNHYVKADKYDVFKKY